MWRLIIGVAAGTVLGASAMIGIGLVVASRDDSQVKANQRSVLCDDALARRRQAQQTLQSTPQFVGDSLSRQQQRLARQNAVDTAQRQFEAAEADVREFC